MSGELKKLKSLCVLVNTVAPYRMRLYQALAEKFDVHVLSGGREADRSWHVPQSNLRIINVLTYKIKYHKTTGMDHVRRLAFFHLNVGLLWWLPRLRPDAVISNEMGLRSAIALVYGRLAGSPVWLWWGGTLHSERNVGKFRRFVRSCFVKLNPCWISYGESSTEYLSSIGVKTEQVIQVQNCIEQELFSEPVPPSSISGAQQPILLCVGQLIERKGLELLIRACGRLQARGATFSLVLVGSGTARDNLAQLARQCGLLDFYILPSQSVSSLSSIYRGAQALVFPTLDDVWGLVVNEAIWAGLPVLCSCYAGCARELIEDSNIFDPANEASFDAALLRFLEGRVGKVDPSTLHTWQMAADKIVTAIELKLADS